MPRHCFNCKHFLNMIDRYEYCWHDQMDKKRRKEDGADGQPCPDWEAIT